MYRQDEVELIFKTLPFDEEGLIRYLNEIITFTPNKSIKLAIPF